MTNMNCSGFCRKTLLSFLLASFFAPVVHATSISIHPRCVNFGITNEDEFVRQRDGYIGAPNHPTNSDSKLQGMSGVPSPVLAELSYKLQLSYFGADHDMAVRQLEEYAELDEISDSKAPYDLDISAFLAADMTENVPVLKTLRKKSNKLTYEDEILEQYQHFTGTTYSRLIFSDYLDAKIALLEEDKKGLLEALQSIRHQINWTRKLLENAAPEKLNDERFLAGIVEDIGKAHLLYAQLIGQGKRRELINVSGDLTAIRQASKYFTPACSLRLQLVADSMLRTKQEQPAKDPSLPDAAQYFLSQWAKQFHISN